MIRRLYDKKKSVWYDTDEHQILAYEHLCANRRAALFLGMSLSKTVVALSYLYEMHYREAAFIRTLVIAPSKVARLTWPDEIETWVHLEGMRYSLVDGTAAQRIKALNADAEIFIVSVDNIVWLTEILPGIRSFKRAPCACVFDCVVIDELDLFKTRGSKRFKKLRKFIRPIDYRIGMTGTPSPNNLTDLWAEIMLLDDGERLGDTWGKFVDKYFTTRGNGMIVYEYKPKPGAAQTIAHKLRDIALTMQTRDYLVLPDLITDDVELELDPFDREIYDRLEEEYALDFLDNSEVTVKTSADLTNKLLQISSGAIYTAPRVWHEVNTVKIDALGVLLTQHPDENFIVVYQFRHEVDRIQAAFPFAREFRNKQDFRDWNNREIRLLLIHPASAGHGLNLQFGGRRMVWFSLTWNLGHYLQTVARLLRRGQLSEIYVHRLIVKGTRDPRVRRRLASKDSNQTFLMNEIKDLRDKYYGSKKRNNGNPRK
jgi:SNF2 family DNA or RNA helicase